MRGLSTLLSHAIYLALGITVMGALLIYVAEMRSDMGVQTIDAQLNIVAESVKQDIIKLSLLSKDSGYSSGTIAEVSIDFPDRIGGEDYTIGLSEGMLTVESASATVSKMLPAEMSFDGRAKIPAHLELVRDLTGDTIRIVAE